MNPNSPFYSRQLQRAVHYANQLMGQEEVEWWVATLRASRLFRVQLEDVQNSLGMGANSELEIELRHQLWRMYRNLELDYT